MWVFTHSEERILRVLAAPHRALQSSFLDHRECAFRVMCDQPTKRLFRRQTFVSVDRDGRAADREIFSEVGFIGRPANGRLYGLRIVRYRLAQAVLIAADEEVALHDSSPMNEKPDHRPAFVFYGLSCSSIHCAIARSSAAPIGAFSPLNSPSLSAASRR
jgi:hypothetical protein